MTWLNFPAQMVCPEQDLSLPNVTRQDVLLQVAVGVMFLFRTSRVDLLGERTYGSQS